MFDQYVNHEQFDTSNSTPVTTEYSAPLTDSVTRKVNTPKDLNLFPPQQTSTAPSNYSQEIKSSPFEKAPEFFYALPSGTIEFNSSGSNLFGSSLAISDDAVFTQSFDSELAPLPDFEELPPLIDLGSFKKTNLHTVGDNMKLESPEIFVPLMSTNAPSSYLLSLAISQTLPRATPKSDNGIAHGYFLFNLRGNHTENYPSYHSFKRELIRHIGR